MIRRDYPSFSSTERTPARTVWGMDAAQLHSQFWASQGVQVVRSGEAASIDGDATHYLLLDPDLLVLFDMDRAFDRAAFNRADVVYARLSDVQEKQIRERVVTSDDGDFLRVERYYEGGPYSKLARILVTRDPKIAAIWQVSPEPALAAKALQQVIPRTRRLFCSSTGRLFEANQGHEEEFVTEILRVWKDPHDTLESATQRSPGVWVHRDAEVDASVRLVGPLWVGAGQTLEPDAIVVGPLVLWDEPQHRPNSPPLRVRARANSSGLSEPSQHHTPRTYRFFKRAFDIVVALIGLAVSLPLYPVILGLIWLEDGRPLFFGHRRETMGGRKFLCLKFRSMRKDAEKLKMQLAEENGIDGPQFYMRQDPRLTRIGAFLRKRQLDELPQFLNVLVGHMSIVGPRPSPYAENQFCPPWRDARLSVRPGITGLWQIKRTRNGDTDFQEWINYDLDYVRNMSWTFDLQILYRTAMMFLGRFAGKKMA